MKKWIPIIAILIEIGLVVGCGTMLVTESKNPTPAPLPDNYYNRPCQIEGDFYEGMEDLEPYGQVEIGGWDCSQMSAYVEWLAENCGYNTQIVYHNGEPGHAWVVIDGQPYDATGFTWEYSPSEFDSALEDLGEAYWGYDEAFYKAWGWWLTYPELLGG